MKVFVCHAPEVDDQMVAVIIADRLQYSGVEVVSQVLYGIPGGENWMHEAENIIQVADWFIVLISDNFNESVAAKRLLLTALDHRKRILPIVIDPVAAVPPILMPFARVDLTASVSAGIEEIQQILMQHESAAAPQAVISQEEIEQEREEIARENPPDRIFIAYSHFQREQARRLSELLTRHGKAVFYDAKIKAGATWRQTIQKALDDATHVIVIWTTEAAESDEVEREVSYALAERKVIVPILSRDIPKLPYHLHGLHYIVLGDDFSTLEADLLKAIQQQKAEDDIWQ